MGAREKKYLRNFFLRKKKFRRGAEFQTASTSSERVGKCLTYTMSTTVGVMRRPYILIVNDASGRRSRVEKVTKLFGVLNLHRFAH